MAGPAAARSRGRGPTRDTASSGLLAGPGRGPSRNPGAQRYRGRLERRPRGEGDGRVRAVPGAPRRRRPGPDSHREEQPQSRRPEEGTVLAGPVGGSEGAGAVRGDSDGEVRGGGEVGGVGTALEHPL